MPYKLEKTDGGYFVVDDKGKRHSDKPMPKWRATRQMRALYAAESNASKETLLKDGAPASSFLIVEDSQQVTTWHLQVRDAQGNPDHRLMGAAWAALHGGYRGNKYEGPGKTEAISKLKKLYASEEMPEPASKNFHVFKQADGQYRWVTFSSSAFRDRDGEIVSAKALADDVERCDTTKSYGPLRWWHMGGWEAPEGLEKWDTWKAGPGIDLGTCDFNMLHGKMLIESGTFKNPELGEVFSDLKDFLEVSIMFSHPMDEPGKSKEFSNIHKLERSLLPEGFASNMVTKFYVSKGEPTMKASEKLAALAAILRGKPELAQQILADAETVQKAAEEAGLEYKEVTEMFAVGDAPETPTPDQPVADKPTEEPAPIPEPVAEKAAPAAPPPAEEPPDEIGDMTRQELADFCAAIVKQMMSAGKAEAEAKEVQQAQLLADALVSIKSLADRAEKAEAELKETKTKLDELTDARPVGIKQLQNSRPTEQKENIVSEVPTGPVIDPAFVQFSKGGK